MLSMVHPSTVTLVQHRNYPDRISKYQKHELEFNMSRIKYPIDLRHIGKFEHQSNVCVNVYMSENKKILLLRITNMAVARHRVNLLYITAGETSHYILMKDLSRLVLRQYSNHGNKKYFCQYCLNDSSGEEVLKNHLERCKLHETHRIKLPEADDKKVLEKVKFTKTEYKLRLSFVIYVDFESVLYKQDSCKPSSSKYFTT